ncbi:C4-type zinc ribbon domain-containing protein [Bacteroidota bacterium]|nr:C4-type zinc ribbon domain-containing protein [Bacteroidota bacterium]
MAKKQETKTASLKSVEEKLKALYQLQLIDSEVDRIRTVRGELPLEIEDLQDSIEAYSKRKEKVVLEIDSENEVKTKNTNQIAESNELIKKYKKQLENIKNNREFVSLTKEIEFQTLEIELSEKKIKNSEANLLHHTEKLNSLNDDLNVRKDELDKKSGELDEIVKETEKEEEALLKKSQKAKKVIDDRLLLAYEKIRGNVKNGLAVVSVKRDACGGCFNKIPPQRQLDIKLHKKIIICEHCGRILVDEEELQKS